MTELQTRRVPYHHGNLPAALAEAAARLARVGGPEAVVLREAARRVGVSPTAAYRHFANHDDLVHAVKEQALGELAARMEAEIAAGQDLADPVAEALRRFRASGLGYVRYALAEPGMFRTAFCRTGKPAPDTGIDLSATRPFQGVAQILDTLATHGEVGARHRRHAEIAVWAAVHGLAVLLIDGPLSRLPPEVRDTVIGRTLDAAIEGICRAD